MYISGIVPIQACSVICFAGCMYILMLYKAYSETLLSMTQQNCKRLFIHDIHMSKRWLFIISVLICIVHILVYYTVPHGCGKMRPVMVAYPAGNANVVVDSAMV